MSALASDAMKGLNKAEKAVNEAKTVVEPSSAEKPLKTAKNGQKELKKELSPETQRAVQQMEALKKFIEVNKLGFEKDGKKYVKADVWQYLIQQRGLTPSFISEEGKTDDQVYYVKTTCVLLTADGREVTRSSMIASKDEKFLKDLDRFAVMGLSQTRALARTVKNVYGYLLVALGFQATPWEEIS